MRVSSKAFEFKDKYLLSKTYAEVDDDDNVNKDGSLKEEAKQQLSSTVLLDFTNQVLIREGILNDLECVLALPNSQINIQLKI